MTLKVENTYLFSRWQHISLRIVKNRPLTRPPEKFWLMTCHFLFKICNFNVSLPSLFGRGQSKFMNLCPILLALLSIKYVQFNSPFFHWIIYHCRGVRVRCQRRCPCSTDNCACPFIYNPVCGRDGETYPNSCVARCR